MPPAWHSDSQTIKQGAKMHGGEHHPPARAVVHRSRTFGTNGIQEVGHICRDTRRSTYGEVSEWRDALPHDMRERMVEVYGRTSLSDFFIGCLVMLFLIALFSIAGYVDWSSDQAYQRAWAEANGVQYEAD